jgi:hypothetical protein
MVLRLPRCLPVVFLVVYLVVLSFFILFVLIIVAILLLLPLPGCQMVTYSRCYFLVHLWLLQNAFPFSRQNPVPFPWPNYFIFVSLLVSFPLAQNIESVCWAQEAPYPTALAYLRTVREGLRRLILTMSKYANAIGYFA